jgi:hypothetical protein
MIQPILKHLSHYLLRHFLENTSIIISDDVSLRTLLVWHLHLPVLSILRWPYISQSITKFCKEAKLKVSNDLTILISKLSGSRLLLIKFFCSTLNISPSEYITSPLILGISKSLAFKISIFQEKPGLRCVEFL